jgi:hypothetical protein
MTTYKTRHVEIADFLFSSRCEYNKETNNALRLVTYDKPVCHKCYVSDLSFVKKHVIYNHDRTDQCTSLSVLFIDSRK